MYAGPFIALALLFLLWAYSARKLEHRFPQYYEWCGKVYDNLPKIFGLVAAAFIIYVLLTGESHEP